MHYHYHETIYHIKVTQKQSGEKEEMTVILDGVAQQGKVIVLVNDGQEHSVEIDVNLFRPGSRTGKHRK